MSTGPRQPLATAQQIAERLCHAIIPVCRRGPFVAGSVRRGERSVGDIEIVCEPIQLNNLLHRLGQIGITTTGGERARRLTHPIGGLPVTIHLTQPEEAHHQAGLFTSTAPRGANFGYIYMIRTGDGDFSHAMVTDVAHGGLRPPDIQCGGGVGTGYVWRNGTAPHLPDEAALFAAWGLTAACQQLYRADIVPPRHRNANAVQGLRQALQGMEVSELAL